MQQERESSETRWGLRRDAQEKCSAKVKDFQNQFSGAIAIMGY